jgi:hypothetical protein
MYEVKIQVQFCWFPSIQIVVTRAMRFIFVPIAIGIGFLLLILLDPAYALALVNKLVSSVLPTPHSPLAIPHFLHLHIYLLLIHPVTDGPHKEDNTDRI